ncbi:secretion system chaperone SscA [Gammaproteobacteria bacterium]
MPGGPGNGTIDNPFQGEVAEIITNFVNNGKTLRELKGLTRENMEAVYTVAYNAYNSGNLEQAEKVFKFLCYFDHLEKKHWMGLAATRQSQKNYMDAVNTYSFAALLDINDPQIPMLAADCHLAMGDRQAAQSGYTAATMFSGDRPEYQTLKARAQAMLEALGQVSESAENGS